MRTIGPWSLSSILEGFLLFFRFIAWLCVPVFVVLPLVGIEDATASFLVHIDQGMSFETEGPDGVWTLTANVAVMQTPPLRLGTPVRSVDM